MSAANKRPLSPFMIGPYYKPQMTSILSITHRATGAALVAGTLLLVYWLVWAARGPGFYESAQSVLGSMLGQLLLFLWTWALFYHLANGIRHPVSYTHLDVYKRQARGPGFYESAQSALGSMLGQLLLFLWTWALFYHLANGIRHLFWDAGYGFEMEQATKSGWWVVWSSIILTFLCLSLIHI